MYASTGRHPVLDADFFRWAARASAIVLFMAWAVLFIAEGFRSGFERPSLETHYQGFALAMVFAGYAIGWWKELPGGLLAILGTLAFFLIHITTLSTLPGLAAAWFAAPGILYLVAWSMEHSHGKQLTRSS